MKYLQQDKLFRIPIANPQRYGSRGRKLARTYTERVVRPVNGEEHFNDVGFSQGFVHYADPNTGEKLGWSGVQYFENHAVEVDAP
jgi:hypothetical protein